MVPEGEDNGLKVDVHEVERERGCFNPGSEWGQ